MARLKEAKLCNIVLVPSRLSASGRNKLHHHQLGAPPLPTICDVYRAVRRAIRRDDRKAII